MASERGKDEVLNRLLEAATVKWGRGVVEAMRPAFESTAEAIWKVQEFQLEAEEEPAHPATILRERRGKE